MPESTQDLEQPTLIMNKDGEPYANAGAAKAAIRMSSKLDASTHEPVEHGGGFAIAAKTTANREGVAVDPQGGAKPTPEKPVTTTEVLYVMCPTCEHKSPTTENKIGDPCANPAKQPKRVDGKKMPCTGYYGADSSIHKETYWWVTFQAKANPYDFEDVDLAVNGEQLKIKRQERVCIPGRFVEAAEHAVRPSFKKIPGKNRKTSAPIMTFPFSKDGQGTHEEYITQKKQGTEQTIEHIRLYGDAVSDG